MVSPTTAFTGLTMNAHDSTPPSGENVTGESSRIVKCQNCGCEWLYSDHYVRETLCPGCITEQSALLARYYYLLRNDAAEIEIEVTVPGEIVMLAGLLDDIHGWGRTDVYNELLNPQPEFVEEDDA